MIKYGVMCTQIAFMWFCLVRITVDIVEGDFITGILFGIIAFLSGCLVYWFYEERGKNP